MKKKINSQKLLQSETGEILSIHLPALYILDSTPYSRKQANPKPYSCRSSPIINRTDIGIDIYRTDVDTDIEKSNFMTNNNNTRQFFIREGQAVRPSSK